MLSFLMFYPGLFGYWCGAVVVVPLAHASTLTLIYTPALKLNMLYQVIIKILIFVFLISI